MRDSRPSPEASPCAPLALRGANYRPRARGFFKGGKATEDRFVATIEPFARKALAECTALKERFEALEASFHGLVERFGENEAKVRGDCIV